MKRSSTVDVKGTKRRNAAALVLLSSAVGVLYLNFDPMPAGADPDAHAALEMAESIAETAAPVFDEIDDEPQPATAVATAELTSTGSAVVAPPAPRASKRVNALLGMLLAEKGIELPEGGVNAWDETKATIAANLVLLNRGHELLRTQPGYTVNFFRQERVDGTMVEGQVIRMKVRHEPFSVYMKWVTGDKGREVLYVDGENEGKMLVHAGGWKARLLPALKLDPTGSIAMRESRYPVTTAGMLRMLDIMIRDRQRDLASDANVKYQMVEDHRYDDRTCYAFQVEYPSREYSERYRKCVFYLCAETCAPLFVKNYGWPHEDEQIAEAELDDATMVEHYQFSEIDFGTRLADADFDRTNRAYGFKR